MRVHGLRASFNYFGMRACFSMSGYSACLRVMLFLPIFWFRSRTLTRAHPTSGSTDPGFFDFRLEDGALVWIGPPFSLFLFSAVPARLGSSSRMAVYDYTCAHGCRSILGTPIVQVTTPLGSTLV